MRVVSLVLAGLLLAFVQPPVLQAASIDTFEFEDGGSRQRFKQLSEELRCPKCQNQNLADSNSPIAADMRREIHRMVGEGQTNDQVVDFMVARYGDFVMYRPRRDSSTLILWYGPIGLLLLGALVVVMLSRRKARSGQKAVDVRTASLDGQERERLKKLLDDDSRE
jgi:cytochrome c-type biogenesis protein CcmH